MQRFYATLRHHPLALHHSSTLTTLCLFQASSVTHGQTVGRTDGRTKKLSCFLFCFLLFSPRFSSLLPAASAAVPLVAAAAEIISSVLTCPCLSPPLPLPLPACSLVACAWLCSLRSKARQGEAGAPAGGWGEVFDLALVGEREVRMVGVEGGSGIGGWGCVRKGCGAGLGGGAV